MATNYIDLVTDGGELIRVEVSDEQYDECHDSLTNAMKIGDWWRPSRFSSCKAEYLGMLMDRISMKKIIGML